MVTEGASRRERKVVSVFFCDLVGYTGRVEELDPEDAEAILRPYHDHLKTELERFGGTVEKFAGDAVMALFGAPVAHEDDPERAVRVALEIVRYAVETGIGLRVGVATGQVLVSLGANPAAGETMATGDVVNTASRLQAVAPVNGVLVGERTYRATRHTIEYRELDAVEVKGKAAPIRVWEALAPLRPIGADSFGETRTPLVGRHAELESLQAAVARAAEAREPQLVTLVGLPGIGKSRLVYELGRIVDREREGLMWRQGRCLAYGDGLTFWALGEIVKAHSGVLESDGQEASEAKILDALDAIPADERDWVARQLGLLVGLGSQADLGGDKRAEAFAAWRRFLQSVAAERGLVLVFEDLHWADDGLLDFIENLVEAAEGVPITCICTARPDLYERRPGWGARNDRSQQVVVGPLDDGESAELLRVLLGEASFERRRVELLERSSGNPLYAEQYVRMLGEWGDPGELRPPETLQALVAARIDLLPEEDKRFLQDASVVGRVVWTGAVASVSGGGRFGAEDRLRSLERRGFFVRRSRSSIDGEMEWAFAHALLRDAGYTGIPRAARAARHEAVAGWIEGLARLDDHAELIAYHRLAALELRRAAGLETIDLESRARRAALRAGDRASALNAFSTAAGHYETALSLCPTGDPARPQLLFRLAYVLHLAGERAAVVADREVGGGPDTPIATAESAVFQSLAAWHRGQRDAAFVHLERAFGAGPTFETTTLRNGVRVVTAPMPQVGSVACAVMVAAGSRHDFPDARGTAHFLEHMLFRGTERRPSARALATEVDALGGDFNAGTGREVTQFWVKCTAAARDVALDILADMVLHSRLDPPEIEREKAVILEEMKMYADTPRSSVDDVFHELLFDGPLGWAIAGTTGSVQGATPETLRAYLEAWYRPERIVVGVAGRIGEGLVDRLDELWGNVEQRGEAAVAPQRIALDASPVRIHAKASEQAHLMLGVQGYRRGHPDRSTALILAVILGMGMSSRLFTELRERRGLAYQIHASEVAYTDTGLLCAQAGVDVARIDEAIPAIVRVLRGVTKDAVKDTELEKARGYAKARVSLRLESPLDVISAGLRREALENRVEEPEEILRRLDAVTRDDVQRVARDLFEGRQIHLAVVGPFDDHERFERMLLTA